METKKHTFVIEDRDPKYVYDLIIISENPVYKFFHNVVLNSP